MTGARILVVDDNRDLANGIAMVLGEAGLKAHVAYSAPSALELLEAGEFELVLSDIRMPSMSGLDLLKDIRARWPLTKVVLITAYGAIDTAVDAMKGGACDYLTKPFDNDALVDVVRRALASGVASGGTDTASVVGDVAAAISAEDLLPSLRSALAVLLEATGADDGEIFLCEPEGRDPLLAAWAGPDAIALADRTRFEPGVGYPGIVVATGKPLSTKGGLADDSRYLRRRVVDAGIRSFVAVPLPDTHGALGSIHLMSRRHDFPTEHVLELLTRAASPVSNVVRAGLAALRQSVDRVCGDTDESTGPPLRVLLESMRQVAGARNGSLFLIDPRTGYPDRVVSTGPASLSCGHAAENSWMGCPSILAAHGFVADSSRRTWPDRCRCGLPRRAATPCCLPLVAGGHVYGVVFLDFGRDGAENAIGRLVPLLTMAHQTAVRLQSHRAGHTPTVESNGFAAGAAAHPTPGLELRCLGSFTLALGGRPVPAEAFSRSKALALLKFLALKAGTPQHRDVLIEHLWPEVNPRHGINRLYGVIHDLRSVIEPRRARQEWLYVVNRGEFYYLNLDAPIDLDLVRFRKLSSRGLRAGFAATADVIDDLERAVELYRGDLFEDDPFSSWCEAERQKLKETHANMLDRLARLHAKRGAPEKALECLRLARHSSPFCENLLQAQMRLLSELGRPAEAMACYQDYRRLLMDDLDAEPTEDIRILYRRLMRTTQEQANRQGRPASRP
ncbi:response regulator [bacterium]|nr:response regulator [bacterium]